MDDAMGVRGGERIGDRRSSVACRRGRGSGPSRDLLAQRPSADELRDHVELAVDLLERIDRGDCRMGERGGGARLAAQPLAARRVRPNSGASALSATWRPSRVSSAA